MDTFGIHIVGNPRAVGLGGQRHESLLERGEHKASTLVSNMNAFQLAHLGSA